MNTTTRAAPNNAAGRGLHSTYLVCANTRSLRKTLREIKNKAKNKNLLKIKRILNTEIQANRGAEFLYLASRGGGAHPCSSVSYATDDK